MADYISRGQLHTIPAPYLASVADCISMAAPSDDVIFSRDASSRAGKLPREYFAAGRFKHQELLWPPYNSNGSWRLVEEAFADIDASSAALGGYISYEAGLSFEKRWQQAIQHPEEGYAWRFAQVPCWYVADHESKSGAIWTTSACSEIDVNYLQELLQQNRTIAPHGDLREPASKFRPALSSTYGEICQAEYETCVRTIKEDIGAGRYYELNFTQRFRVSGRKAPEEFFISLFNQLLPNQAFFCRFGYEAICSFSPELYLNKYGTRVSTRPIKGSMVSEPSSFEAAKLSAEHVMVVDLARNDLGRVSDLAPVKVAEFMHTNKFGGLNHLESEIVAQTSCNWSDILRRTYPAASITGAPKVEVVQAIQGYERSPRGGYTGSCGWLWPSGDLNMNVAIRTATASYQAGEWHYTLGAGGAIVADSDPEAEYLECLRKVYPLLKALTASE